MDNYEQNILALYFSPRKLSNSGTLLDCALDTASVRGIEIRKINVRDYNILPCDSCDKCLSGAPCPIADDMGVIYDALEKSGAIIISTPIYFYGVPAKAKAMIDRCQTFWARKYLHASPLPLGRHAAVIAVGGSAGEKVAEGVRLTLKYFLDALSIEMPDMLVIRNASRVPGELPESELRRARIYGNKFAEKIKEGRCEN